MQYIHCLWLLLFFLPFDISGIARSFLRPRDVTTDSALELALINYHRYHHQDDEVLFYPYVKPFFMQSINGKKLARYFLPHHKPCIKLDESGNGDVDPLWFNLISPEGSFYTSTVCLRPQRTIGGALFTVYFNLTDSLWLGINSAAMQVKNNPHLQEKDRTQPGTIPGFQNAYEAFNNPAWTAGKISTHGVRIGGFDDFQFKLGYDFFKIENYHTTFYGVLTAPTGKRPQAVYLFEPLIGSKNWSFGAGINAETLINETIRYDISFMVDFKYRYILGTRERRSFDLINNGDWSRYLLVVTPDALLNSQPGINLLTFPVKVTPGSTIDLWAAVNFAFCNWNIEFGYELWWRQAEKLKQKRPIPSTFGIQTLALCGFPLSSASTANISQAVEGTNATITDSEFVFITNDDINFRTGAQPTAMSNKVYLDIGYTFNNNCYAPIIGFGGFYEFAARHALEQWGIWMTFGLVF